MRDRKARDQVVDKIGRAAFRPPALVRLLLETIASPRAASGLLCGDGSELPERHLVINSPLGTLLRLRRLLASAAAPRLIRSARNIFISD